VIPVTLSAGEVVTILVTLFASVFNLGLFWARVSSLESRMEAITTAVELLLGRPVLVHRGKRTPQS
jgi:hypothetical protein